MRAKKDKSQKRSFLSDICSNCDCLYHLFVFLNLNKQPLSKDLDPQNNKYVQKNTVFLISNFMKKCVFFRQNLQDNAYPVPYGRAHQDIRISLKG